MKLYWEGAGLDVYTDTLTGREERADTASDFTAARHSARLGELGVTIGRPLIGLELVVPTWLACAVGVAPLAVVVIGRIRRGGWVEQGHCPVCGYDLRATPGRCPECGTEPSARPTADGTVHTPAV